jgi:hypothetical protein
VRYGERTARGIAGGKKVCWALTLRERRRARIGKRIMVRRDMIKDILDRQRHLLQATKTKEELATRRVEQDRCRARGKGWKYLWAAALVTRP